MRQSPFLTKSTTPIAGQVSSLELQDPSGNIIPINNLSHPIAIYLKNNANDHRSINGEIDPCIADMTVHNISITEPNITIRLEANCSSPCFILWKKGQNGQNGRRLTTTNYDVRWNLTSSKSSLKRFISWEDLNGAGDYYLGIYRGNVTNESCGAVEPLVYNISVHIVSCMYWDEEYQRWSTYGCQVSGPIIFIDYVVHKK